MASLIDANCLDGTAAEPAGRARIYDTVIPIAGRGEFFVGFVFLEKCDT